MPFFAPRFQAFCPRCGSIVRVPEWLPLAVFSEAIALRQSGHTMQAIAAVAQSGCADHAEAKRFVFHLTAQPGQCHRYRRSLVAGETECTVCHSINLDFTATLNPALQRTGRGDWPLFR